MRFKESNSIRIVLLTGHHIQRHPGAAALDHLQQILYQTFKQIQLPGYPYIQRTLGPIQPQPGALPSGQQHGTDLAVLQCVQPLHHIELFLTADLINGQCAQRHECASFFFCLMLQPCQNRQIHTGKLLLQLFLLCVVQCLIIRKDVFLSVSSECIYHTCMPPRF